MDTHNYSRGRMRARVRARLRKRDGDLCCWCHELMEFGPNEAGRPRPRAATIEHIIPRSAGGSNTYDNLALAHHACNSSRKGSARPMLEAAE